jgi:deazaflavin-dependent oxidoreductase (nitroreductase family)
MAGSLAPGIDMPIPKFIARINRSITNPLTRQFAGRIPPFAIMTHTGRRSGNEYRIPIMAFPSDDEFVIALTYGAETDWVRNVLASDRCTLEYRRQTIRLEHPRLLTDPAVRRRLPRAVRFALRLLRVDQFLVLVRNDKGGSTAATEGAANT